MIYENLHTNKKDRNEDVDAGLKRNQIWFLQSGAKCVNPYLMPHILQLEFACYLDLSKFSIHFLDFFINYILLVGQRLQNGCN
jgi:hypothetical protein